MKKIRVAFCLRDMQIGGVESVLIRTFDELLKNKNIELSLITYVDISVPMYREYLDKHPEIKVYSLYPGSLLGTKLPHFFMWRLVIHVLRDIYRNAMRFMFGMRKFHNIDVFIDYHSFGFHKEFKHIKSGRKIAWFHSSIDAFLNDKCINYCENYDKIVVLTDDFINQIDNVYPEQNGKFIRIYNPFDTVAIQNMANEKTNKISGDYFCCVSRLSADKDIITLLKGFDLFWLSNNKPNVKLVIVGDGNKAGDYKKYANSLESSKQIVFVGATKNPFVYMKNARANILSSFSEGLPTVLIESMIVGTVNIASDCKCGPREILLNGDAGMLFKPGDATGLAKCMTEVYNNNVDVKQMIAKATKSLNRFDSHTIMRDIISQIS